MGTSLIETAHALADATKKEAQRKRRKELDQYQKDAEAYIKQVLLTKVTLIPYEGVVELRSFTIDGIEFIIRKQNYWPWWEITLNEGGTAYWNRKIILRIEDLAKYYDK